MALAMHHLHSHPFLLTLAGKCIGPPLKLASALFVAICHGGPSGMVYTVRRLLFDVILSPM